MAYHKTSAKMVNMQVVRLTYHLKPYLIIAGAQARKSVFAQFEN